MFESPEEFIDAQGAMLAQINAIASLWVKAICRVFPQSHSDAVPKWLFNEGELA